MLNCPFLAKFSQRWIHTSGRLQRTLLLQMSSDWKASVTNRMQSNDLEAYGKICLYFCSILSQTVLIVLRCTMLGPYGPLFFKANSFANGSQVSNIGLLFLHNNRKCTFNYVPLQKKEWAYCFAHVCRSSSPQNNLCIQ